MTARKKPTKPDEKPSLPATDHARPVNPAARMVEVSPGRYILAPAGRQVPDVVMCRATPNDDGTWRLCPECVTWARMDSDLLRALGLASQWQTLYRLARAGFVEMVRVAPHTYLLNLDSWFNHLTRCAEDPEFWAEDGRNRIEYRRAL